MNLRQQSAESWMKRGNDGALTMEARYEQAWRMEIDMKRKEVLALRFC